MCGTALSLFGGNIWQFVDGINDNEDSSMGMSLMQMIMRAMYSRRLMYSYHMLVRLQTIMLVKWVMTRLILCTTNSSCWLEFNILYRLLLSKYRTTNCPFWRVLERWRECWVVLLVFERRFLEHVRRYRLSTS